jgi:hypothetical protein
MGTVLWGPEIAAAYDQTSAAMYAPEVLGPAADWHRAPFTATSPSQVAAYRHPR